ncbi:MAG: TolC family protein, partial [Chthoniobacteraceae bacterium]
MFRILTLVLLTHSTAFATGITLSLDDINDRVRSHNPQLAAARLRIDEAHGRLDNAGRLTNPSLDFDFAQNVRMPERGFRLEFMQRFPLTGRLPLEKAVSRAQLAAAEAEVRDVERNLVADARALAVRLLALRHQRALRVKQIANSRELAEFMTKRVATGEAALVDASQVQLERGQLDTALLLLDSERAALLGELRPLLGMRTSDPVGITGELPMPSSLPPAAVNPERRGDFQSAQRNTDAARESAALERANKWADIGIGLTAQHTRAEDAPDGFQRDTMLGLKFS